MFAHAHMHVLSFQTVCVCILILVFYYISTVCDWGYVVVQLVEALRCKLEGCGFDS